MCKIFQVDGCAVNKCGLTAGTHYTMTNTGLEMAKDTAQLPTQKGGYEHVRISFVREVKNA